MPSIASKQRNDGPDQGASVRISRSAAIHTAIAGDLDQPGPGLVQEIRNSILGAVRHHEVPFEPMPAIDGDPHRKVLRQAGRDLSMVHEAHGSNRRAPDQHQFAGFATARDESICPRQEVFDRVHAIQFICEAEVHASDKRRAVAQEQLGCDCFFPHDSAFQDGFSSS